MGRDEPEPVVRNGAEPTPPRPDDRRFVRRQRRRPGRRDVRHRGRHRHWLFDPPPGIVLRGRRPEAELGAGTRRRCVPALPVVRHRWADGDDRRGGRDDVVGARRGAAAAASPRTGWSSACSRGRRRSAGRPCRRTAPRRHTSTNSRHSEPVSSRPRSRSRPTTPGPCSSTRRRMRIARRFPRAPASTARTSARSSSSRRTSTPPTSTGPVRSVRAWRTFEPEVDLYVAPVLGVELPPVDCDELDIRIPTTAFLRPFNVLGWAAIAIGDLQLIAPSDEVVIGAALAWERAAYGLTSAMSSAAGRVTSTFEPKPAVRGVDDDPRSLRRCGRRRGHVGCAPGRPARTSPGKGVAA